MKGTTTKGANMNIYTEEASKEIELQLSRLVKGWDDLSDSERMHWCINAEFSIAETGKFEIAAHKNIFGQLRYIEM
jgi:hypothetical protein